MTIRIAIVDMGSNTLKFSVTEVGRDGREEVVDSVADTVRLGAGVARTGRIEPERMARALDALVRYETRARALGAIAFRGVATAALRMAGNGADLLARIDRETAWNIRVISGAEEARLTFLGLRHDIPASGHSVIADIGGASTELIHVLDGEVVATTSVNVGSGTLADQCFTCDPPGVEAARLACDRAGQALHGQSVLEGASSGMLVLSGGNGTFLLGLTAWDRVGLPFVVPFFPMLAERVATIPSGDMAGWLRIQDERARMLPAGAAIALALVRLLSPSGMLAVPSGIRGGLVEEWRDAGCPPDPP